MSLSVSQDPERERDETFRQHAHLIRPIARQLGSQWPEHLDDLTQVGAIGLLRAIERRDPEQAANFKQYAAALIAGEMRHYLRDLAPLVRPPRDIVELRSRVLRSRHALEQTYGEAATAEAIATHSELPVEKVLACLTWEAKGLPASLDEDEENWGYQLIDNRYTSFQLATEDRLLLEAGLGHLRAASREVIEFAFYEDLTQTEIAKKLNISQMQVSRRLRTALGELWKVLNARLL